MCVQAGQTALDQAREHNNPEVALLLTKAPQVRTRSSQYPQYRQLVLITLVSVLNFLCLCDIFMVYDFFFLSACVCVCVCVRACVFRCRVLCVAAV